MNTQKPEPAAKGDGSSLDFHSMFFTIQGEGPFSGHRSIFVRLAGCNLQCPGCDTEYTEGRTERNAFWIVADVEDMAAQHDLIMPLVVITGGEPLRQPIGKLVDALMHRGYRVQIESNGVFAPDPILDGLLEMRRKGLTLVVSPKTSRINARTAHLAHCFKYVLDFQSVNPDDGLPIKALEHKASTGVARAPHLVPAPAGQIGAWPVPIYLSPYDTGDEAHNLRNLRAVANSSMKHGYIAGIQLHKLIGLE